MTKQIKSFFVFRNSVFLQMMKFENKRIIYACVFPLCFVILLWIIETMKWGLDAHWHFLGVFPREINGLQGIVASPLIHADFSHLLSNTIPLFILGWCLCYFYTKIAYRTFFLIWITSGLITWYIGRESWHIGASSLIYGLSFFLFLSGILRNHIPLIAISMLVTFLYGSIVWNMFPISEIVEERISWEGHLSGALTGIIWAIIFRKRGPQKPLPPEEEEEEVPYPENVQSMHPPGRIDCIPSDAEDAHARTH